MSFSAYTELLSLRAVRRVLVLGLMIRIPLFGSFVVLVLHVVEHLQMSYGMAGLLDMASALALAISGPWRGRLLDRIGLRRTLGPALVVYAACWAIGPWVGYWPLLGLVAIAGLFCPPVFTIVRQVMIASVPRERRTAALSLDSVFVEFSFMLGPVLGVWLATTVPTPVALVVFQAMAVFGGAMLWLDNPRLVAETDADDTTPVSARWRTPWVFAILAVALTASLVLTGADLGTVAALRETGHRDHIGWVLALWGLSSAVGGILYGSLQRHPPSYVLMFLLAGTTIPIAFAGDFWVFVVLLFLSGFFCAPTLTATTKDLADAVPARRRGEAMGMQGSAMTLGGAIGAPVVGFSIDHAGWEAAFAVAGAIGAAVAVLGVLARTRTRSGVDAEGGEDLAGRSAAVEGVEVQPRSPEVE